VLRETAMSMNLIKDLTQFSGARKETSSKSVR